MRDKEIKFVIVALMMAAIIGGFIGDFIGSYLPEGAVKTLFIKSLDIGLGKAGFTTDSTELEPFFLDLYSISFAFCLLIKINFVSLLMVILVIIYFKWWYI